MLYEMLWKFINWDKSAAAACVRCCLIPLVVGVALWFWLPDTLLGWSTNQGAFIGGAAKWQAVLLIPLLYTAVEVWFIWLVTKSARKRVAGTVFPWVFAAVALLFFVLGFYPLTQTSCGAAALFLGTALFAGNLLWFVKAK